MNTLAPNLCIPALVTGATRASGLTPSAGRGNSLPRGRRPSFSHPFNLPESPFVPLPQKRRIWVAVRLEEILLDFRDDHSSSWPLAESDGQARRAIRARGRRWTNDQARVQIVLDPYVGGMRAKICSRDNPVRADLALQAEIPGLCGRSLNIDLRGRQIPELSEAEPFDIWKRRSGARAGGGSAGG